MKIKLRSIFLTSDKPEATATFYRDIAGVPMEEVGDPDKYRYWRFDDENLQIAVHDAREFSNYTHPVQRESNLTHLYFSISDIPSFVSNLTERGLDVLSKDEATVTVVDPDGRKVIFGTT